MKPSNLTVVGIKEMYRNHPFPNLPNFKLVSFADKDALNSADLYIQNNILEQKRNKVKPFYHFIKNSNKPWLCVESAVFRRNMIPPPNPNAYHRWSWFSYFRDEGDYNNVNCPPDRWLRIQKEQNIEIKDWRTNGECVLLIMQRPGDSSLKNLLLKYETYENFLQTTIANIRKNTDRKIRIRLHPARHQLQLDIINKLDLPNIEISPNTHGVKIYGGGEGGDGLYEDFRNAWVVVGFNSNALTESVCEGIPTFSLCPSSMAYDCSDNNIENIEAPRIFDRDQWLANLGYCQWTEREIHQGLPWNHLKVLYEKYKV